MIKSQKEYYLIQDKVILNLNLYFKKTDEGEKKFCWFEKDKSEPEIELYLFKDDAIFSKVKKTNGGRIYYLHF